MRPTHFAPRQPPAAKGKRHLISAFVKTHGRQIGLHGPLRSGTRAPLGRRAMELGERLREAWACPLRAMHRVQPTRAAQSARLERPRGAST